MKKLAYIIIGFGLWMIFTFKLSWENIIVGILVSTITVFLFGKYFVQDLSKLLEPKRYYWFIVYLFVFIWECIKANFDVAYRVLHPDLPIKPGIVKTRTTLKTDVAKTTLANSITMTPGTITMDIINDDIYIHWIYVRSTDPNEYGERIVGKFEKYIKKIFE
ncbi:Na+/H+ antiporter subunit E [Hyphobacterium sp. CCMP332]|nr:Na+/H+ antiporter subunit E [Hyphobacterium sp. CCMP332]